MSFIAIPLKQTGDVDLVKPITTFLSSKRNLSSGEKAALNELQALRNKMVATIKNKTYCESSLVDMQNYFDQLGNLELKVPFSQLKIYFKWLDCFDKGSWLSGNVQYTMTTNLLYEKACVLFNIAALSTQMASSPSSISEEEMKNSARLFQVAAGLFSAVSVPLPESSTEQKPTPDLSTECASALSSLCLAQAQEIVLMKAISDQKKESITMKLSQQAGVMYGDTYKLMEVQSVKSMLSKDWLSICEGKHRLFTGLSQWFSSRQCNEEKQIGEEISRLGVAVTNLQKAKSVLPPQHQGDVGNWLQQAETALGLAKKDNDFIYHEKVPPLDSLSPIVGTMVVKLIPLEESQERFATGQEDLFAVMPVFDPNAKKTECIIS